MFTLSFADLIDPRGRADRRGLLKAAGLIIGLQILSSATAASLPSPAAGTSAFALQSAILWLSFVAVTKRLHDLGYAMHHALTAVLTLAAAAFATGIAIAGTWGDRALLPGAAGYLAVAAVTILPLLAAAIWLHAKPGQPERNKFGDPPGHTGFSFPSPTFAARNAEPG